jgi:hypothetical protein
MLRHFTSFEISYCSSSAKKFQMPKKLVTSIIYLEELFLSYFCEIAKFDHLAKTNLMIMPGENKKAGLVKLTSITARVYITSITSAWKEPSG